MPDPTIRALLTDLDGVIRLWASQDDAGIERDAGLPGGAIKDAAFAPDLLQPAITGRITDEAWRQQTTERLRSQYPEAAVDDAMAAWSNPAGEIDDAVMALVQQVRQRIPVALVTNATSRLPADLAALGILDAFDHVVNSSVVGAAKPDATFYTHALELTGSKASETFYMDDTERYIGPATELGLVTHLYRGIDELRADLTHHGLLP